MRRRRQRWVVIPGWERFQHYGDRRPVWVKNYTEQLDNEDYLELPAAARGLLHDLRLLYAKRKKVLPWEPKTLSFLLGYSVTSRDLNRLRKAGFLGISASKPASKPASDLLATQRAREDVDVEPPKPPTGGLEGFPIPGLLRDVEQSANGKPVSERLRALGLRARDLRKYTGCRETRGSHSRTHHHDVLGTDRPPPEWPHPKPKPEEILTALEVWAEA